MKRTMLILAIALMASSVASAWTYNAGDAMEASYVFVSEPPVATYNPSGQFTYLNAAGALLIPTGGVPASGQPGWVDPANTGAPQYGLFWNRGWAGWDATTSPIVGHGPSRVQFLVPAFENAGSDGVVIDAQLTQLWEAARQVQLLINGQVVVIATAEQTTPNYGSLTLFATAGDIIEITIDRFGPDGNDTDTFAGWDVTLTETVVPEPMTMALLGLGSLVALRKRR